MSELASASVAASEPGSDWALVLELATGMASAYPLELAPVSEWVTASGLASPSATVLRLVSESRLV